MALRLTAKVCHCCNRGIPQNALRIVLHNRLRNNTWERVNRWTCPSCRSNNTLIELFGRPITAARYAVLAAM